MPAEVMKVVQVWLPFVFSAVALYLGIRNDQRLTRQEALTAANTTLEARAQAILREAHEAARVVQSASSLVEISVRVSAADRPAALKLVEAGKAELRGDQLIVQVNRLPLAVQSLDRKRSPF